MDLCIYTFGANFPFNDWPRIDLRVLSFPISDSFEEANQEVQPGDAGDDRELNFNLYHEYEDDMPEHLKIMYCNVFPILSVSQEAVRAQLDLPHAFTFASSCLCSFSP